MSPNSRRLSRRQLLAATALAACTARAPTAPPPAAAMPEVAPSIRRAATDDLAEIVALLEQDARARTALDSRLWRPAPDAPARLEAALRATLGGADSPAREQWLVAEHSRRIVGVMHTKILAAPPIYDPPGPAGLLLDDCFVAVDAPSGTAEALLAASEAALKAEGVSALIASCPAGGRLRAVYEQHGYEPVTHFMAKHGLELAALPPSVRPASEDDVPGIVSLSAAHRRTLEQINSRFWHIHAEADSRFDRWMRRSLTLEDRNLFVAAVAGEVRGYVIAQPASPLLIPSVHDTVGVGVIDDFYDSDFASVSTLSSSGASGDLLLAAENAFAQRDVDSALVVCPAAWPSKVTLLERRGYRTAKSWLLKA